MLVTVLIPSFSAGGAEKIGILLAQQINKKAQCNVHILCFSSEGEYSKSF